jgi:hypothetical protein
MTAQFKRSTLTEPDGNGIPIVGAQAYIYNSGTTTPRAAYSDATLTTPIVQPFLTDADGRWPQVFVQSGVYRYRVIGPDGTIIHDEDQVDPGLPTSAGGLLPVASGGTGAANAGAARSNLGAAAQSDLDATNAALTTAQTDIDALQAADATFMPRSGGTFTGPVSWPSDPTTDNHLVRKAYLDDRLDEAADYKLLSSQLVTTGFSVPEVVFDFSPHSGYEIFELRFLSCRPTADAFWYLEVSPNVVSWVTSGYGGTLLSMFLGAGAYNQPTTRINLTSVSGGREHQAASSWGLNGMVELNTGSVDGKAFRVATSYEETGSSALANVSGFGGVLVTTPLVRARVYPDGTPIAQGRFQLWGRK